MRRCACLLSSMFNVYLRDSSTSIWLGLQGSSDIFVLRILVNIPAYNCFPYKHPWTFAPLDVCYAHLKSLWSCKSLVLACFASAWAFKWWVSQSVRRSIDFFSGLGCSSVRILASWFVVLIDSIGRAFRQKIGVRSHSFRRFGCSSAHLGLASGVLALPHSLLCHFRSNASFVAKVRVLESFLRPFVVQFLVQNLACSRTRTNQIRIRSGSVLIR